MAQNGVSNDGTSGIQSAIRVLRSRTEDITTREAISSTLALHRHALFVIEADIKVSEYNFPASVISNTVDIETQDAFGVPNSHAELLEAVQRAATNTFNREGPFLLAVATRELAEEMALTSEHSEVITIHTGFMERRSLFKLSVLTEPLGMSISGDAELAAKKEKCGWLILHRVPWEAVGLRADRAQIERGMHEFSVICGHY